ncbi:hypothetical protein VDIAB_271238 [Vibrio diabolicus]|nr:hypothetical protein VDIAB_271238 [Vibrio diabolicus]
MVAGQFVIRISIQTHQFMFFGSDRAYASRVAIGDWELYVPTPINLDSFVDNWLKGIHSDGHLVGLNWDANLCGTEVVAIDVAKMLVRS